MREEWVEEEWEYLFSLEAKFEYEMISIWDFIVWELSRRYSITLSIRRS